MKVNVTCALETETTVQVMPLQFDNYLICRVSILSNGAILRIK